MRPLYAFTLIAAAAGLAYWLARATRAGSASPVDAPEGEGGAVAFPDLLAPFADGADALQGLIMPGDQTTLSADGLVRLQAFEGFSATPYRDASGYSIGYGHFIKPGESFARITLDEGAQLLAQDVAWAERAVRTAVKVPLTQSQFDALVSFTYNVGEGALRSSTLLRKLNAGDYQGAASEFPKWVRSSGAVNTALVARRSSERQLFEA